MKTLPYQTIMLIIILGTICCLNVATATKTSHTTEQKDTLKFFASKKNGKKDPSESITSDLPDISNNRDIDVDALKRRAKIPSSKGRSRSLASRKRQDIGHALPNKGSYEDIGDGVYLVDDINSNNEKAAGKSAPARAASGGKSNDGIKSINQQHVNSATKKIHSVDQSDRNIALSEASFTSSKFDFPAEQDFTKIRDVSAQESLQDNAVGFVGNENLEGVSTNEQSMLKNIEKNLKLDDKLTGLNMEHEVEDEHRIEASRKDTKGLTEFQKIMLEGKKEFDLSQGDKDDNSLRRKKKKKKRDYIGKPINGTTSHVVHEWRNITGDVKPLLNGTFDFEKKSKINEASSNRNAGEETNLHYEDLDEIDDNDDDEGKTVQGSKRNIDSKHKSYKKKSKQHRTKNNKTKAKQSQRKGKKVVKATSKKEKKIRNEAKELSGLIKVLNKTDPSNTKLRLKPKQNSLTIDEKTSKFLKDRSSPNANSKEDGGRINLEKSREVKILGTNSDTKRKTKSEVEEAIDSNDENYITPDTSSSPEASQQKLISVDSEQAPIEIGADGAMPTVERSGSGTEQKSFLTEGATSSSRSDEVVPGGDEVSSHAIEGGSLNQQGAIHVEEPTGMFGSQPAAAATLNFVAKSSDHKESGNF